MAFENETGGASCSTCLLRPKVDGGRGGCPRVTWYPILKERASHNCPLFKRQPQSRPKPGPRPEQTELF